MIHPAPWNSARGKPAFSLIEVITVIAVLVILMVAGVGLMGRTGTQARRAGTDLLMGMIEQARGAAITSRSCVILAVAEPGDLPAGDQKCRLGLFKVTIEDWEERKDSVKAVLMSRWRTLESGVVLLDGAVDGLENPLDAGELTVEYGGNKPLKVKVHALAFHPRGGLVYPTGSSPVALRVAEGNYRAGKAAPFLRAGSSTLAENRLKIGRVTARPYRFD